MPACCISIMYTSFFFFTFIQPIQSIETTAMKLRDRKKHVMDSIKQEDCKPSALTTAESPAFITANTNTSNLTIKQEDATKDQTLLLNNKHGKTTALLICSN